jgi:hypothetical protein
MLYGYFLVVIQFNFSLASTGVRLSSRRSHSKLNY